MKKGGGGGSEGEGARNERGRRGGKMEDGGEWDDSPSCESTHRAIAHTLLNARIVGGLSPLRMIGLIPVGQAKTSHAQQCATWYC